jgi:predicted deacylase
MRIQQLGEGTPEVAIVAGIHGDEPCGVRALERLAEEAPDVDRPVKLVVANEEALEAGERYLDEDLNRAFPGDPEAENHEARLAAGLATEIRECTTLSLHSTQSYDEPFALVDTVDAVTRSVTPHLPVDYVVETAPFSEGRLIAHPHTVEVECGLQGSDEAAENAYWVVRAFLAATGVLAAPMAESPLDAGDRGPVTVFRLGDRVPKDAGHDYEVFATNFERVEAEERFAAVDGRPLTAERPFYPVLMSPYGYEDVFGYAAEHVGELD